MAERLRGRFYMSAYIYNEMEIYDWNFILIRNGVANV